MNMNKIISAFFNNKHDKITILSVFFCELPIINKLSNAQSFLKYAKYTFKQFKI